MSTLQARLSITLPPTTLQQALTHSSFNTPTRILPTNDRLEYLGQTVLKFYILEHLHMKYPNLPAQAMDSITQAYIGDIPLGNVGSLLGVQQAMRWTPNPSIPQEHQRIGSIAASCVRAIIGAMYHEKGVSVTKKFIHSTILSRQVIDIDAHISLSKTPKLVLREVLKSMGKESPVSRLLKETGRLSATPVFIVGIYSGAKKIGEGHGSSILMAETRAARDALSRHFLKQVKDFQVPSETESLTEEETLSFYKPNPIGTGFNA